GPFDTTPQAWYAPTKVALPPGAPLHQLAIGDATLVVREDGTVVSFGANPPIGRASSLFPDPYPASLTLSRVLAIDLATDNVCAVAGGTGSRWGARIPDEVDVLSRAYPKEVVIREPIVDIATTPAVTSSADTRVPYRWCAVGVSGDVYCWGFN